LITPEKKDEIIDGDYQGKSKEDISDISKVSTGTVFNVVKEHEQEIGKGNRESIRRLAKFVDKKKIPFEQISNGVKIYSLLKKYKNVDAEKIFSLISKIDKEKNPQDLLEHASHLMEINKESGKSYLQTVKEHEQKSQDLARLTKLTSIKSAELKNLDSQYEAKLKRNDVTANDLSEYNQTKAELRKYGLSIEESPKKSALVLQEIGRLEHNPRKIVRILDESETLNEHIQKKMAIKNKVEEQLILVQDQLKEAKEALDSIQSSFRSFIDDIIKVEEIQNKGFETDDLIAVADAIQKNGFTVNEFLKILNNFEDITTFMDGLIATKDFLVEEKNSLSLTVDHLKQEKISLKGINEKLSNVVMAKITKINQDCSTLVATNPIRELYTNSGNPFAVVTITVTFLKKFKEWLEIHIPNPSSIIFKIEDTIKLLEKVMPKIAAR